MTEKKKKHAGSPAKKKSSAGAMSDPIKRARTLIEILPVSAVLVDTDGIIRHANMHTALLHGYGGPAEMVGMNGIDLVADEDRSRSLGSGPLITQSTYHRAEYALLHKDGTRFTAEIELSPIHDEKGTVHGYLAVTHDISERAKIDAALRESEERYRRITAAITDYIYTVRIENGRAVETIHSPACEAVTGYSTEEFNRDPYLWIGMVHEEDRGSVQLMSERIMSGESTGPVEHRIWRKDGSLRWIRNTPVLHRDSDGRVVSYDGIVSDITDQQHTESALRESEERYRIISELSTDYVFKISVNRDGSLVMTYVSENLQSLTGRTHGEVASSGMWRDIIHPEDFKAFVEFQIKLITDGEPGELECRSYMKDGTMRWIHIFARPLRAPGSTAVTSIVGAIKDVTDRKIAEAKLLETQTRLEFIIGVTGTGIDIIDAGFNLRYVDPEWQKLYGPYEGKKCHEYFMGRDCACPTCGIPRALETKEVTVTEEVLPHENNRIIEVHTIPFQSPNGEWMVAEFNLDITERKKAEERIRASLGEKETLLKEIHHRVKNNLQIITSLLSLQSRYFTDKQLARQFNEAQNRIRSMALVHEKLYQSKDFGRIDFRSYIIQLSQEIMASYAAAAGSINLTMDIDETDISIDQAIPCGLIINELVTNSIKHAFPPGWAGTPEIAVTFHVTDGILAKLVIKDNGVGIPEGTIPGQTDTLGLSLVPMLAQQVNGEATLERTGGTTFTIRFTPETVRGT